MRALIQRVSSASAEVDEITIAEIQHGLLIYVGDRMEDAAADCEQLAAKVVHMRIFPDQARPPTALSDRSRQCRRFPLHHRPY